MYRNNTNVVLNARNAPFYKETNINMHTTTIKMTNLI